MTPRICSGAHCAVVPVDREPTACSLHKDGSDNALHTIENLAASLNTHTYDRVRFRRHVVDDAVDVDVDGCQRDGWMGECVFKGVATGGRLWGSHSGSISFD